jgi:hypothetical protein
MPLALICCVNGACCTKKTEIIKGAEACINLSARFCTLATLCLLTLHLSGLAGQAASIPSMAAVVITDGISKRERVAGRPKRTQTHKHAVFNAFRSDARASWWKMRFLPHHMSLSTQSERGVAGGGSFVCARESKSLGRGVQAERLAPRRRHYLRP